ncbi:RHS repeat domain-containing protein [Ewingella americana]|uniref:RHS repeat-associated core domain-containing protein n=1 Tax=Ewingella americana TaxID=41202 RepID=A0A502GB89_9GAMM|nr:RHS repeat-associated core domain-containing protein [Ewingella americana]TPG59329.1 RHS repeat-associated core domain-containing protein [Ewingella americana]
MDTLSTSAEKEMSHVPASNKRVLQGTSDGQEFSQSDALSFSSFRRGSVDPRTGSFNYTIPIARITGNHRRGPSLQLSLKHNHFSSRNEGFGAGWSLGLSKFFKDNDRMKLLLRDGRIIDLIEKDGAYIVETVDLKNFILTKLSSPDNGYKISYKDGSAEILKPVTSDNKFVYVTDIIQEDGYKLSIDYYFKESVSLEPFVKRVYDELGDDLLIISRTGTNARYNVAIEMFKNITDLACKLILTIKESANHSIESCLAVSNKSTNILTFTYQQGSYFRLIKKVESNFFGPATEIINYDIPLAAPAGSPFATLPAVSSYQFTMVSPATGKTSTEEYKYSYGEDIWSNNFLGYNGVTAWDKNAIDNIYACRADYTYFTQETFFLDNVEECKNKFTYDKYHRVIKEEFIASRVVAPVVAQSITTKYTYPGNVSGTYSSLPATYKLPISIRKDYIEKDSEDSHIRAETSSFTYDQYGNVETSTDSGGVSMNYIYYPAAGKTGKCPKDKNGFVRYLSSSDKYQNDLSVDSIENTYTYQSLQVKEGYDYVVENSENERKIISQHWSDSYKKVTKTYYGIDDKNSFNRGKLKTTTLILNGQQGITTSHDYSLSTDGNEFTISTTQKGADGKQLVYSETAMTRTGWPVCMTDALGVMTVLTYDKVGRIVSTTRAKGTNYESTTKYTYGYDPVTNFFTKATLAPNASVVTETYDALGNVVKQVIDDKVICIANFNTQSQLLSEVTYDYDVPLLMSNNGDLTFTETYLYDALGNVREVRKNDDIVNCSRFNIGDAVLVEYIKVAKNNDFYCYEENEYDRRNGLPLSSTDYNKDGKTKISQKNYYYDVFHRVNKISSNDVISGSKFTENYEYDFFDRPISRVESEEEGTGRTLKMQYWGYDQESKLTEIAIDNISVGYQDFDTLGRIIKQDRNPAQKDKFITRYKYKDNYTSAYEKITPNGEVVNYVYIPELDLLPAEITMPEKKESFSYVYDKDTVKLVEETHKMGSGESIRTLEYDSQLRLITEEFSDNLGKNSGHNVFTYTYCGRLISITKSLMGKPTQTTYYRYDEKGRLLTISAGHDNETDLEIEVLYLAGNYPSLIKYRMIQSVGKDVKYSMQLVYDHKFRISEKRYYDEAGNLISTNSEKFNGVGKVISKDVFVKPDKKTKTNFKFDYLGRLISAAIEDSSTHYPLDLNAKEVSRFDYQYDKFDNMTSSTARERWSGDINKASYSYNGKNPFEMTSASLSGNNPDSPIHLTYDAAGNVIKKKAGNRNAVEYQYDAFNKLMKSTSSSDIVSLGYNDSGNMQSSELTIGSAETQSRTSIYHYSNGVFDVSDRKQSPNARSQDIATYIKSPIGVEAINILSGSSGAYTKEQTLLLSDRLGSVYAELKDQNTDSITSLTYTPYGHLLNSASIPAYDPVRFAGEKYDDLTELYHLGNGTRSYDPLLMRFMQYDSMSPFGEGGINPYSYCGGDPITFSDPSGHGRDVAIMFAAIGLVFSVIFLGLGVLALLGGAALLLGGISIASGILGTTGGALGVAAAAVEDDELSQKLSLASGIFTGASFALGLFPAVMFGGHKLSWKLMQAFSKGRIFQVRVQNVKFYPGASYRISAPFKYNNQSVRLINAHGNGNKGLLAHAVENSDHPGQWIDKPVSVEKFAQFTKNILVNKLRDNDSALFITACGGSQAGANSNAQSLANYMNRSVYAFPAGVVSSNIQGSMAGANVTYYGVPWFVKPKLFTPVTAMGNAVPMLPLA